MNTFSLRIFSLTLVFYNSIIKVALGVFGQLGILWSGRGETKRALTYLLAATTIYGKLKVSTQRRIFSNHLLLLALAEETPPPSLNLQLPSNLGQALCGQYPPSS